MFYIVLTLFPGGFMFAAKYSGLVEKIIPAVLNRHQEIKKASEMITDAALSGKRVFVTDRYGVIDSEVAEKPAGLALFRSLSQSGEKLSPGDILILSSFLPEDEKDMEIVKEARSLGVKIIAIAPEGQLAKSADLAITDPGGELNAVLDIARAGLSFAPLNGIIHVLTLYMIEAETAEKLLASGKKPTVLCAGYLAGGEAKLLEARRKFASQGY
jgi:uncharacterized phosphosugar-binding protein